MDNAEETPIPPKPAVLRRVPDRKFFSVEFPGHIENLERAKEMIGGDRAILNAYLGGAPLDLRYRIKDPFSIPIQGETVSTPNLLLKATRRYKVKRQPGSKRSLPPYRSPTEDDVPYNEDEPQLTFEVVGTIPKTTRFSGLADYQQIVDPGEELVRIKNDLVNMDYESLISIKIDNTNPAEDLATLQLVPPPAIGKSIVPMPYKYKARHREDKKPTRPGRKPKRKPGAQRPAGLLETTVNVGSDDSGNDDVYE
ncbi:MAG: RNA polymerase III transcription factor IIIC subunit-domain-containing protein [Benniella sp.]|nr:MAG: RNA polymerase III transcription factor IIIC subunit-domain-containing protein [Benniella sp.]